MNLGELWTFLLELIGQIIIPVWNDLIQYLPLALLGLVIILVAGLAWYWQRNAAANRSRVPNRLPAGRMPSDTHLPGPSRWPFVAPIGLVLMTFSLALGLAESLATLALFGLGFAIGVVGIRGWYLDAGREYRRVELGGHADHPRLAAETGTGQPARAMGPPEGVHLPGPSAWPFLAPIGLVFAVAGLIFGPALIIGGLIMGAIAVIGWLIDAGREYAGVEAHGHAEPATRDPEKAFPKALGPAYVGVAGVVLLITLLPWALSLLPGAGAEADVSGPPPTNAPSVAASAVTEFEVTEISVFADEDFELTFENKQPGVPHNVAIYDSAARSTELFVGEIVTGPDTRVYPVAGLAAGEYFYVCSVHPPMTGTLYAK